MDDITITTAIEIATSTPPGEWALVEIFGHRRHWGLLREVERFGAKMARVDVFFSGDTEPAQTHFYGGGSIFSITPATEDACRKNSDWQRPQPVARLLGPASSEPDPDEYETDFDEIEEDEPGHVRVELPEPEEPSAEGPLSSPPPVTPAADDNDMPF